MGRSARSSYTTDMNTDTGEMSQAEEPASIVAHGLRNPSVINKKSLSRYSLSAALCVAMLLSSWGPSVSSAFAQQVAGKASSVSVVPQLGPLPVTPGVGLGSPYVLPLMPSPSLYPAPAAPSLNAAAKPVLPATPGLSPSQPAAISAAMTARKAQVQMQPANHEPLLQSHTAGGASRPLSPASQQAREFAAAEDGIRGPPAAAAMPQLAALAGNVNSFWEVGAAFDGSASRNDPLLLLRPKQSASDEHPAMAIAREVISRAAADGRTVNRLARYQIRQIENGSKSDPQVAGALVDAFAPDAEGLSPENRQSVIDAMLAGKKNLLHALMSDAMLWEMERQSRIVHARVKTLYKRFFPEFFRDFAWRAEFYLSERPNGQHQWMGRDNPHEIALKLPWRMVPGRREDELEYATFSYSGEGNRPTMQRRISTLMVFFHEYAHGIFAETLGHGGWSTWIGPYQTLDEGFAVMLELLLIDKLIGASQEFGFSAKDIEDLKNWKKGRLSSLRRERNHYTKGVLQFWHRVYKQGGEAAMLRFLHSLDDKKLESEYPKGYKKVPGLD